jgi:site-specific DNA recombinase
MRKPEALPEKRRLRCAIYTRKSSEEGLEQEFNSLDAQREACEAFILSQRQQDWALLPQHYDDGGLSGATMERPALRQLLADIQAGKVEIVVVYKIDRLTRALADFARIVEIFDAKGASFVSVTQQFNTTTSMGRLTLNVLLSFAQFEREVTGERIRDKIAASKQKGMWMGGVPPLGYRCQDHKLAVVENEAETVRHIFRRYAALGSVRLLRDELDAAGTRSKSWTSSTGRHWGGRPLVRGALYRMLQNRIYRGEIVHKDRTYPGEHRAIVDVALWEDVQQKLAANGCSAGERRTKASLLVGLLFDAEGHRLTPTHANKKGRRYRYYVSQPLVTGSRTDAIAGLRVPAGEIERLVTARIGEFLSDPGRLSEALARDLSTAEHLQSALKRADDLAARWPDLTEAQLRPILVRLIGRADVHRDRIDLQLTARRLAAILRNEQQAPSDDRSETIVLSVPMRLQRAGLGIAMIVGRPGQRGFAAKPDAKLIRLIVQAHRLRDNLNRSATGYLGEVASSEKLSHSYFTRVVRLSFLAPDITLAILEGRQPRTLTADRLRNHSRLPLAWAEQRHLLGFDPEALQ